MVITLSATSIIPPLLQSNQYVLSSSTRRTFTGLQPKPQWYWYDEVKSLNSRNCLDRYKCGMMIINQSIRCTIWTFICHLSPLLRIPFSALAITSSIDQHHGRREDGHIFRQDFFDHELFLQRVRLEPGWPVNCSATLKFVTKKNWIQQASNQVFSSSRQFIHPQDRNDVLQFMVTLKDAFWPQMLLHSVLLRFLEKGHGKLDIMPPPGRSPIVQFTFQVGCLNPSGAVAGAGSV